MIEISSKTKAIIVSSGLLIAFALGRYSSQQSMVETTANTQSVDRKQTEEQDHTQTVVVYTKNPDGAEKTITTINNDIDTKTKDVDKTTASTVENITPQNKDKWQVSALVGVPITTGFVPIYGIHVTKEILGPINIGAFGFTNGLVGISVGLAF